MWSRTYLKNYGAIEKAVEAYGLLRLRDKTCHSKKLEQFLAIKREYYAH